AQAEGRGEAERLPRSSPLGGRERGRGGRCAHPLGGGRAPAAWWRVGTAHLLEGGQCPPSPTAGRLSLHELSFPSSGLTEVGRGLRSGSYRPSSAQPCAS